MVLNYVQHIFPGREKNYPEGFAPRTPLVTVLRSFGAEVALSLTCSALH